MNGAKEDNLESLRRDAAQTAELCSETTLHLINRANVLNRRRRFWRIFEVLAAALGIFTQTAIVAQYFEGSSLPLLVGIICFLALLGSSIYQANVVSDSPDRIHDHLHYIYYYAAQLNFLLEHRTHEPREIQIGRLEELLMLAHKNLDDARQKWNWAVPRLPTPTSSK